MNTPVVPSSWSTERQDLYEAIQALIAAFRVQVPDVIRKQWAAFPPTMAGEAPFIYIECDESVEHDMQTRRTVFTGFVGYVDPKPDAEEATERVNLFADYMRDLFTANARILPNREFRQVAFVDGERQAGGVLATDPHVTFESVSQVGRDL